ncbi:hypothetical protein D3C84_609210 [compost metagenome]
MFQILLNSLSSSAPKRLFLSALMNRFLVALRRTTGILKKNCAARLFASFLSFANFNAFSNIFGDGVLVLTGFMLFGLATTFFTASNAGFVTGMTILDSCSILLSING